MLYYLYFFFFSSRRRHTRYWRDWSSDVCSSDLPVRRGCVGDVTEPGILPGRADEVGCAACGAGGGIDLVGMVQLDDLGGLVEPGGALGKGHHEDGADREVGCDEHTGVGGSGDLRTQGVDTLRAPLRR